MAWPYVVVETSCTSILISPSKASQFGQKNFMVIRTIRHLQIKQRGAICMLEQGYSYFHERLVIGNKLKAYQEAFWFTKIIFTMAVARQKRVVPTEV